MPIDNSIYQNQPQLDIVGGIERGMRMRDMMDQRALQKKALAQDQLTQETFAKHTTVGPDGKVSTNRDGLMSDLAKGGLAPEKLMGYQDKFAAQDKDQFDMSAKKQAAQLDYIGRVVPTIKDQATWDAAKADAAKLGHDTSDMPAEYDPAFVNRLGATALSAKDRMDNEYKDKSLASSAADRQASRDQAYTLAGVARGDRMQVRQDKIASGENLPIDSKNTVNTLATKNANKSAIRNQLSSVMSNWDGLSETQKVAQGRQILKTMNSLEGSDAIGVEEAKRLGGMLEFAVGNLTNSNPTQWGRNLPGFKEQVQNTIGGIDGAIKSNKQIIDQTMGRAPQMPAQSTTPDDGARQAAMQELARRKALAQKQGR